MELKFRVYLRQHLNGLVHAKTVGTIEEEAVEPTREAALAAIESSLKERISWSDSVPAEWLGTVFVDDQYLYPVTLDVALNGNPATCFSARFSLLVTPIRQGERVFYGVETPQFVHPAMLVSHPDQIPEIVCPQLVEELETWSPFQLLALDQVVDETLEVITLTPEVDKEGNTKGRNGASSSLNSLNLGDDDAQANDVLGLCGICLCEESALPRLGHADRRDALVERLLSVLTSERLNSIMLVGRPDVGKSALVHELARRISQGTVPPPLQGRELWSVTANNLIAGMKYYGEWQGRAQALVRQVREGRQILYMGDPGEVLSAGRYSGSDNNLGRYLRPYVETGDVVLICECSPEAYDALMIREPSFMQGFRRVDVDEPDDTDTHAILQAVARRLETEHPVRIDASAVAAIQNLTRRFFPYRAFPGKAVRFLEELTRDQLVESRAEAQPVVIEHTSVVDGFVRATGLPRFILADSEHRSLASIRTYFEERLLGQPEAVEAMSDLITVLKAGLNDPQKPLGSFFFVGPTGVGKTEMAKVLAEFLFGSRDRVIRFDMSEYASGDALARLIGSAWGHEEGELTRRVRAQPFCVVLLDELEKANPEVFDALLGVLGEGRLTDARGRTTDFRNAIIVMTSNLAASRREMHALGFAGHEGARDGRGSERIHQHFVKEAEGFFRPEFFNRIDRIVAFRALTSDAMRLIARRELGKLLMREGIVRRNLLVEIDAAVIDHLVEQGFHPLYGARPLQREIERTVILPLAKLLVDQGADHRHLLRFSVRDGKIHLGLVVVEPPDESETIPELQPDRRLESDLATVNRTLQELHARYLPGTPDPLVEALQTEVSALLARTREPTFWDEADAARDLLKRIYHLERVLKRLDTLTARLERLEEWSQSLRRQRDRSRLPDLARAVEHLETEFSYLEIELAGAAGTERHDQALIRIVPVGPDAAEWATRLLHIYTTWAQRKGYECHLFTTRDRNSNGSADGSGSPVLYVKGPNVYEFLRGEAGLHKLDAGAGDTRRRQLARVLVLLAPELSVEEEPGDLEQVQPYLTGDGAEHPIDEDSNGVVRTYHLGRFRFIRDPRTGVRLSNVASVLEEGHVDPFLLARLRQRVSANGQ